MDGGQIITRREGEPNFHPSCVINNPNYCLLVLKTLLLIKILNVYNCWFNSIISSQILLERDVPPIQNLKSSTDTYIYLFLPFSLRLCFMRSSLVTLSNAYIIRRPLLLHAGEPETAALAMCIGGTSTGISRCRRAMPPFGSRSIVLPVLMVMSTGRRTFGLVSARHLGCWRSKFDHESLVFFRWAVRNGRATAATAAIVGVRWWVGGVSGAPIFTLVSTVGMTRMLLVIVFSLVVLSATLAPPIVAAIVAGGR